MCLVEEKYSPALPLSHVQTKNKEPRHERSIGPTRHHPILVDTLSPLHLNLLSPYFYDDVNNNGPAGKDTQIDTVQVYHARAFNLLLMPSIHFYAALHSILLYIALVCCGHCTMNSIRFSHRFRIQLKKMHFCAMRAPF
jgi:hypothetical protein